MNASELPEESKRCSELVVGMLVGKPKESEWINNPRFHPQMWPTNLSFVTLLASIMLWSGHSFDLDIW